MLFWGMNPFTPKKTRTPRPVPTCPSRHRRKSGLALIGGLLCLNATLVAEDAASLAVEASPSPAVANPAPEAPTTAAPVREMGDVVVTATRRERLIEEVPVRTEVISATDIERTQARTLADAVEFTTGIRVENNCQNCGFSQIRMLGLDGGYVQILQDGRPLMSSLAMVYGIEQIPTSMVDRIEVVKGGGSALYGPGALGGVINIISREPWRSGGSIGHRYETFGSGAGRSTSAHLDWVPENRRGFVTVFGQFDYMPAYDRTGDGFSDVARRRLNAGGARVSLDVGDNGRLVLDYTRIDERRRGGDRLERPVTQSQIAESIESTIDMTSARWIHNITDDWSYQLGVGYARTERDTYYGTDGDPDAFGFSKSPVWNFDAITTYEGLDALALTFGAQAFFEKVDDAQPAYSRFISERYRNVGVFAQAEWEVTRDLEIVLGGRVDDSNLLSSPVFSPRLAAAWRPQPELTLRASAATGFRAPQVFDEDLHIELAGGEAQVIRNDADLKEETAFSYTLGAEWRPEPAVGRGAFVEGNVFTTRLRDTFLIVEDDNPATPETEFTRINRGGSWIYGAEINVGWDFGDALTVQVGYVEQRARLDDPDPDFGSRNVARTPERYGVVTLDSNWRDYSFFVGGKLTGPMEVPHFEGFIDEDRLARSPWFFTVDAAVSRHFDVSETSRFTLTAGVKNIFDSFQKDLDRGPLRDADYVYGPRFPRTFHVGASFDW